MPAALMVPRVPFNWPPAVRVASPSLASVPSWLIRSPVAVMARLPACRVPAVLSKRST